ncbi:hypothetical protein [Dietzia sp.]|uniref:hypothetical protein n=1 Tax=Dietzia sp. TaxID=1871616 RepID=UPI002FD906B7
MHTVCAIALAVVGALAIRLWPSTMSTYVAGRDRLWTQEHPVWNPQGTDASSPPTLATFAVLFSVAWMAGMLGVAFSAVLRRTGPTGLAGSVAASVGCAYLVTAGIDYLGITPAAPVPGVFYICLPIAILAAAVMAPTATSRGDGNRPK